MILQVDKPWNVDLAGPLVQSYTLLHGDHHEEMHYSRQAEIKTNFYEQPQPISI